MSQMVRLMRRWPKWSIRKNNLYLWGVDMVVGLLGKDSSTIVETFSSIRNAANEFGVSEAVISRSIKHGRLVQRKYRFVEVQEKEKTNG